MGLKPPLNKSQTLNDDPLGYGGGKGNVHLNCRERKNEKSGPASVSLTPAPPMPCKEGGTGEGRTPGKAEKRCGFPAFVAVVQLLRGHRAAAAAKHGSEELWLLDTEA